jgi:hypothetical protein
MPLDAIQIVRGRASLAVSGQLFLRRMFHPSLIMTTKVQSRYWNDLQPMSRFPSTFVSSEALETP